MMDLHSCAKRTKMVIVCLLLCLGGCKYFEKEEKHLSPSKMKDVLLDVNIAESYSILLEGGPPNMNNKQQDSLAVFYKRIFQHHQISEQDFSSSLEWYRNHPSEMDSVFNAAITMAAAWQQTPKK